MKGTIIIGHGSRSQDAKDIFFKVVDELKLKMQGMAEGCFMELSEPDIPSTFDKLYSKGVREFTILPYFLFNGIHMKVDIPEILKELKEKYGDVSISITNPIGYHSMLIDILIDRIEGEKTCI
jgi:sirohydrochlorin cobaltochelatase